ncbi:MAG: hypothetical protein G01um101418_984 [Parcubacteria group bacterium Gr01-1014_18]|nr:MAG: hypothetical protein Greene041636_980 [Parcubacteria group bacterium Greene0416_36]TSC79425.1 MAG: hypothetical protein G01um101418_984 [Parcubacteria group bacterium Gr01-1014_18]TSC97801.1 MAG: hypothetical protein Greene101420_988 [Parcubacteria group bacterium Greene1014_20]TSD06011.1 MAG: hypothetical protein Greene07142_959 [Parcubacteria group bacterium Greene0714_2]
MCGSAYISESSTAKWIGGFYQVYPIEEGVPIFPKKYKSTYRELIQKMFPDGLEAYCIEALILAAAENQKWAGATYDYIDRLAIGGLRRVHGKIANKRLAKWIWSFGKSKELTRADVSVLLLNSFISLFWGSMKGLIQKGYIRVEQREIEAVEVDAFFPTLRLVEKLNVSLTELN